MSDDDELASINGVRPKKYLADGEKDMIGSKSSSRKYGVHRSGDHYYCDCPAWKMQKNRAVDARTCKHLKELLGDEYEEARMAWKGIAPEEKKGAKGKGAPAKNAAKKAAPKKAASKEDAASSSSNARGRKRKAEKDDDDDGQEDDQEEKEEEEEEEEEERPKKKGREVVKEVKQEKAAPAAKKRAATRSTGRGRKEQVEEDAPGEEDGDDDDDTEAGESKVLGDKAGGGEGNDDDELACIDGVKPKNFLGDGERKEVESHTSSSKYRLARAGDHFYCTCPAWRLQKNQAVDARTCKHLKEFLGEEYEAARLRWKSGDQEEDESNSGDGSKKRKYPTSVTNTPYVSTKKAKTDATAKKKKADVLLADKLDITKDKWNPDPVGWWMSEKLDGVRVLWDGEGNLLTRNGNAFSAPDWWKALLPRNVKLDGELWIGRSSFSATVSIVRSSGSKRWAEVRFKVFDIPSSGDLTFEDRIDFLKKKYPHVGPHSSNPSWDDEDGDEAMAEDPSDGPSASNGKATNGGGSPGKTGRWVKNVVDLVEHVKCKGKDHLLERLKEIESYGGEGLMLRKPGSKYVHGRSSTLLKVKSFYDAEARVIGYEPGKGKYKGMTGALKCEMASGKEFSVGSGLSDEQRSKPPKIGSIITYKFQECSTSGIPRFPTFVGERLDMDEPKDAELRETVQEGAEEDAVAEEEE